MTTLKGHRTKFTNKGLSNASKAYLKRQSADRFVHAAHAQGYRARSAFKIKEIHDKYKIFKPGQNIVDLGCAPGGWCQVAQQVCGGKATIVGIDLLPCDPLAEVTFLVADFMTAEGEAELYKLLPDGENSKLDVVMSDMAANTTGHRETDGLRTMGLAEAAADFALRHLKAGGHFVTKLFMNGEEKKLMDNLRPHFTKVVFHKPDSSRADSREIFLVALARK